MSVRARLLVLSCVVEGGLLVLAFALGAWLGAPPFAQSSLGVAALAAGLPAVLPLLVLLAFCLRSSNSHCVRIRELLDRSLLPLFEHSSWLDLLFISVLAGLGEEALFRGVLQVAAEPIVGVPGALVLASLLFGLAHAVTPGYVVLAALMGGYLGLLFVWCSDIWLPIVAHAAYDFIALAYLRRRRARVQSGVSMLLFCFGGASFLSTKKARRM
jgi:membrane protease YdiL (CAAX protease family)